MKSVLGAVGAARSNGIDAAFQFHSHAVMYGSSQYKYRLI